jgi:hypothetical protein
MPLAFAPGFPPPAPRLLERFLPPLDDGVAAQLIQAYTRPGDLILDPFGQVPAVAVEALGLDRRIVVASPNPILRLALSLAIRPPALSDLRAALTQLGDTPVGSGAGDRLELQIRAMYATTCTECSTPTTADSFEWDSEAGEPVEKRYICQNCGGPRQAPADEADKVLARRFARSGLDYHFLLERITAPGDSDRGHAEEALAVYPARTLAAIGAVLVKFEALGAERETRRLLSGLLAAAFDASTVLAQERPKVLSVPRRFRECNFWLALENGLSILAGTPRADQSATLDALLAQPGAAAVHAHPGALGELAATLPPDSVSLVLAAVPRPNPALRSLSAVWAAWLWGRKSSEPMGAALRRRRYDWNWHARAVQRSLAVARAHLKPSGRLVGIIGEAEPSFISSALIAAAGAGLRLDGWAMCADTAEAQFEWVHTAPAIGKSSDVDLRQVARAAAVEALRKRGEPSRWSVLHCAALAALAQQRRLPWLATDPVVPVNRALEPVWQEGSQFTRLDATSEDEASIGLWYLADAHAARPPLADQVEAEVVRHLAAGQPVDEVELIRAVSGAFPGEQTPERGLVLACLASYAAKQPAGFWELRPEDEAAARADELAAILGALRALAAKHGYEAGDGNPQVWREVGEGQVRYQFVVLTSAAISPFLLDASEGDGRQFLVLPGGRASLVETKLRRDPRLRRALDSGKWTLVKYRQIRRMLSDASLTRSTLDPALAGDPLEAMQQLALIK